jgi:hypothetical protein
LKTIELHIKRTLDSQIESREYEGAVPTYERHQSDTGVSFWNRVIGHLVIEPSGDRSSKAKPLDHPMIRPPDR